MGKAVPQHLETLMVASTTVSIGNMTMKFENMEKVTDLYLKLCDFRDECTTPQELGTTIDDSKFIINQEELDALNITIATLFDCGEHE